MKKGLLFLMIIILAFLSGCTTDRTEGMEEFKVEHTYEKSDRVTIALLDTGVSETAIQSEHLLKGYNYVTNSYDTEDMINHGTAVASVILGCKSAGVEGAAVDAYIVPLVVVTKEEGKTVSVSPDILAKAIRDSVDVYGADIINISLGIKKDEPKLLQAVKYAEEKGVLVVSAVGNGGSSATLYYPAAYDMVMAVGSCDKYGQESDFCQSGYDVLAMGEDIWLASRNGIRYGACGTSYATGYVAATAADILMHEKDLSLTELRNRIIEKATALGGYLH